MKQFMQVIFSAALVIVAIVHRLPLPGTLGATIAATSCAHPRVSGFL
jgi:hypothetical protein